MAIVLPPLPFAQNALEPFISAETLQYHYGKHHQAYVTNLNKLIQGTPEADKPLEEIILKSEGGIFNNAAQVWNHTFYWSGLKPGAAAPQGVLADAIQRDFGSVDALKDSLLNAATTQFGSGWAWLVLEGKQLKAVKTGNADLPMKHNQTALWVIDVWEHAYYIDYRNDRPKYVKSVLDNLMNWEFIAGNLAKAKK
jgi:Fe-Mn family superoxide dismutase